MKMEVKPCEHMQCNTYDRGLVLTVVITFVTAMERRDDINVVILKTITHCLVCCCKVFLIFCIWTPKCIP